MSAIQLVPLNDDMIALVSMTRGTNEAFDVLEAAMRGMSLNESLAILRRISETINSSTWAWCEACQCNHCGERCKSDEGGRIDVK